MVEARVWSRSEVESRVLGESATRLPPEAAQSMAEAERQARPMSWVGCTFEESARKLARQYCGRTLTEAATPKLAAEVRPA